MQTARARLVTRLLTGAARSLEITHKASPSPSQSLFISRRHLQAASATLSKPQVTVTFVRANGERIPVKAKIGDTLLDVVVDSGIDLEGYGACEGTLTCSTCHVILKKEDFDRLPERPGDEEMDMLDLAHGLTDTSRLGCQITLTQELDGLEIQVPATINDARK
ncbi:adrenodoxin-like protein 2, mitochondrial Ferredoxin 2 [Arctopsyche grandis]|uniref:adrenodoxin-like protein 2, mitochondrial Ferredoxin 2 n=1 Tax=Arctopsyche grandis TaxID=121162 RepID=UPI00406D98B6